MDITSRDITAPRILIWTAVSSKEQATEDKSSLTVQEQEGRAYAERVGGVVVDVIAVPGHTRDLWRWADAEVAMPAYGALRRHCEAQDFDVLFAWDADRLGRDPALSAQALSLVKRAGASVYVHSGGYTVGQESESASYIYAIDTVRSGQEQKRRVKRHHFGMAARVRRGLHPGRWPYGYKPIRDARGETIGAELVPIEAEAIRALTRLYLDGHGYRAIRDTLNERGYPPPSGDAWTESGVRHIAARDIYTGYLQWGDVRNEQPSDKFPHLWDPDTHKAIIRERHRRARNAGGSEIATFLSGVVICGECGHKMAHTSSTRPWGSYSYYQCRSRKRYDTDCQPNNVREADLIDAFDAWLDSVKNVGIDVVIKRGVAEDAERLQSERDALEGERAYAHGQLDRLAAAVAAGTIRPETARATEAKLYDRADALGARIAALYEQLAALPNADEQRAYLEQILHLGASNLDNTRKHRLNRALRNLGVRVLCVAGDVKAILY